AVDRVQLPAFGVWHRQDGGFGTVGDRMAQVFVGSRMGLWRSGQIHAGRGTRPRLPSASEGFLEIERTPLIDKESGKSRQRDFRSAFREGVCRSTPEFFVLRRKRIT